jgi:pimeloyl-ACP methyl ester carboxylesterase
LYTEFIKKGGTGLNLGSYYERIEESHLDISAFVEILIKEGYQKIGLIGHSLGTIKAVRYLFEGEHKDKISRLILLAPFDKNAFLERNAPGKWQEQLAQAEAKIADGKAEEIVPIPEFEEYPITYRTFVSWYNQTDLSRIWDFYQKDYDFPILKQINIPVKVIIGSEDVFIAYPEFGVSTESAMDTIKKHIKDCETVVIKSSGHTYLGFEDQVADEVVSFSD